MRSGFCCQGARRPRWGRRCRSCPARENRSMRSSSSRPVASSSPNSTVAGQAQNANNRAVGAAAIGTVLGAGLGAAIGGGRGAAIGAGSGAIAGTGVGMGGSSNEQYGIQQQYDNAFAQCMYAKGNMVPGYGPMMVNAPPPPPPPPGYNGDLTCCGAAAVDPAGLSARCGGWGLGAADQRCDQPVRKRFGTAGGRRPLAAVAGQAAGDAVACAAPLAIQAESAYLEGV